MRARRVPDRADRSARLRHRAGDARRLRPPLPAVSAEASADAKHRFEAADWHGQQRAQRERIEFYDLRVDEGGRAAAARVPGGRAADGRVAAGQAALHRPADRPPPARAGRDLLQLGDDQDPAPQLLPQRLHLRAAGGLDRVHRERRAGRAADLPRLLPDPGDDARDLAAHRQTTSSSSASSKTWSATSTACWRPSPRSSARSSCAPTSRSRCCRRCSSATRAPTWSARSSTASTRRRSRCRSCTTRAKAAGHRRRAVRRGRPAAAVQLRARLLHGRRWKCRRPTCSSCARMMPRKPRSEIYNALGLAKQGKTLFYRDFLYHLRHFERQVPHRARHQGHGDAGVRPAVLPLRVQGHQGLLTRRRRTPRASRSRASTCWSSSTTASAAWPTRWSTATSRFPRERFEDELVAELQHFCAQPARGRRRPAGDPSSTSTSSAA